VATAREKALAAQAGEQLRQIQQFARSTDSDSAGLGTTSTITANECKRDLLLPALAQRLSLQALGVQLRITPPPVFTLDMLRNDECQLAISPRQQDGANVLHKHLFDGVQCLR
jgi:hypothetical protein